MTRGTINYTAIKESKVFISLLEKRHRHAGTNLVVAGLCRDWTLSATVVVSGGQQTVVPHWLTIVISGPGLCLHTARPDVCDTSLSDGDRTHKELGNL